MENLKEILRLHKQWLNGNGDARANLCNADLHGADLCDADLRDADLCCADLCNADLCDADLRDANLRDANLRDANLCFANLSGADLHGADIDYTAWPLWCGSTNVKIDERTARQLLYHAFIVARGFCEPTDEQKQFINDFHRVTDGSCEEL